MIDIIRVADEPGYNVVSPAPHEYLLELFGTTQPTVAEVEAAVAAHRVDGFSRWHGMYLVGYVDGTAKEIFFVGHSGD